MTCAIAALALAGCKKERTRDPMSGLDQKSRDILEKANIQVDTERLSQNCLRPGDAYRPISDFTETQRLELIACANREVVRVMTPRLPLRVDALTTLTSVVSTGPLLTYNSRVSIDASQLAPAQIQQLHQATRANVCGQAAMRQTISLGGSYAYVWIDRNGRSLPPLRIDSC
ncbi:MAG TPA: hypothetical protein VMS43_05890 [Allosphingosinicella sp.]|nr:hypothetical protein [Allosphingosinicella sp.]